MKTSVRASTAGVGQDRPFCRGQYGQRSSDRERPVGPGDAADTRRQRLTRKRRPMEAPGAARDYVLGPSGAGLRRMAFSVSLQLKEVAPPGHPEDVPEELPGLVIAWHLGQDGAEDSGPGAGIQD